MPARFIHRALIAAVVIVAVIGIADGLISREPDLLALFVVELGLGLALAAALVANRRSVAVRADLAAWLVERATMAGESPEVLADRAIATYRLQLGEADVPSPDAPG